MSSQPEGDSEEFATKPATQADCRDAPPMCVDKPLEFRMLASKVAIQVRVVRRLLRSDEYLFSGRHTHGLDDGVGPSGEGIDAAAGLDDDAVGGILAGNLAEEAGKENRGISATAGMMGRDFDDAVTFEHGQSDIRRPVVGGE